MSTDLRAALRDAVTDAPTYDLDPDVVATAGGRRVRRRAHLGTGAAAAATAAVLATVALVSGGTGDRDPDPARPEIRRLDLDDAVTIVPDVVATTRTTWRDTGMNALEFDRIDGITADGLLLRTRYTNASGFTEVGLLDPVNGTTDWLPTPPANPTDVTAVELGPERLVLVARTPYRQQVWLFDRVSRTWEQTIVRESREMEGHLPARVAIGPEGRLYVGSTMEGEVGPLHWWSAALPEGGQARAEESLDGLAAAWNGGATATADPDGHVVVTTDGVDKVLDDRRPRGCDRPEEFPDAPVQVLLAGVRPVVSYACESGALAVVYGASDGTAVGIPGATALAADDRHVVLAADNTASPAGLQDHGAGATYVLDLATLTIDRIGIGPHEPQVGLTAGLLLWNVPGHLDDNDVYDVRWRVARLE